MVFASEALLLEFSYGNTRTWNGVCPAQGMGTVLLKLGSIAGVQFGSCAGVTNVGTGLLTEGSVVLGSGLSEVVGITKMEGAAKVLGASTGPGRHPVPAHPGP